MIPALHLAPVLWILPLYFLITLLVGWAARRPGRSAADYLNASRSLPLPIVVLAFLASNCGALDVVGLAALAAQYGVQAFHFYWIGAIPAMVFLALVMMPVYRRSGVRSVPEYLLLRYGPRARLLNSVSTALVLLILSGISLYAMAQALAVVLGLAFFPSIVLCASVVLAYVLTGGIRATIYNEVFQLAVMLAGLLPLAVRSARILARSPLPGSPTSIHLWSALPLHNPHVPFDLAGVSLGLGFVLAFSYWCTDFVLMQRAFMARTESEARQVPLWAGFGKLFFSFLVVLPGLAAARLLPTLGLRDGHGLRYDQAIAALMQLLFSPLLLGLGLTALAASLMSGLAANVSAFASLWTQEIYRTTLQPHRTEAHYLRIGRLAILVAILLSMSASWLNFLFTDLMEHVQLVFSVIGAPFFAIFLLGITTRRTTQRGAILGFLAGAALAFAHSFAVLRDWFHFRSTVYGSVMSGNFYAALYSFTLALLVAWFTSRPYANRTSSPQPTSLLLLISADSFKTPPLLWILAAALLAACLTLNLLWR